MATNNESGHAKNVANFENLLTYCTGYGTAYNPANATITIAALQAKYAAAQAGLQALKQIKTSYDNATNSREILFETLKRTATRVVSALAASAPAVQTIADAKTVNRKLQGKRSRPKSAKVIAAGTASAQDTAPTLSTTISVSQQSFDARIDNLAKLIETIAAEPLYSPNEDELKAETLTTLLTKLKTANTAALNATAAYSSARISRNVVLYAPGTGLVSLAAEVKLYVKSLFGASGPQYKQISSIVFKKLQ